MYHFTINIYKQKTQKCFAVLSIFLVLCLSLTGCKTSTESNKDNSEDEIYIDEDSRDTVIRSNSYDPSKGETGSCFTVMSADNFDSEDEKELISYIENSEYCDEIVTIYETTVDVTISIDDIEQEFLNYEDNAETYTKLFDNYDGYQVSLNILSTEQCDETILTASQIWEGYENIGYSGKLQYTFEAGDEIDIKWLPNDYDIENEEEEAKYTSITIDKVSMDTPWWCNEVTNTSLTFVIMAYDDFCELVGDLENCVCYYTVKTNSSKLREEAEEIAAGSECIYIMNALLFE